MSIITLLILLQVSQDIIVNNKQGLNTKKGKNNESSAQSSSYPKKTLKKEKHQNLSNHSNPLDILEILFFADINGKIARPGCNLKNRHGSPEFLHLKQLIRTIRVTRLEKGQEPPVTVFGGSYIGPDPFGEFLFSSKKGSDKAAQLIDLSVPDVIAIGPRDLESGANKLHNYIKSLRKRKRIPIATNLEVKKISLQKYKIITRNKKRVIFLSLLSKDEAKFLPENKNIKILDPIKLYEKTLKEQQGNWDIIVLISHLDTPWTYPSNILKTLKKFKTPPDIVLSTDTLNENSKAIPDYIKTSNGTIIITNVKYGMALSSIKIYPSSIKTPSVVFNLIPTKLEPLPLSDKKFIDAMMNSFCQANNKQLGITLDNDWKISEFKQYVLGVMQAIAKADVAVIDDRMFMKEFLPLKGSLTTEGLLRSLRSDPDLVLLKLKGDKLKSLLTKYLSKNSPLVLRGLSKKGSNLLINGREIDDNVQYRIVTTRFLAAGGGGWLPKLSFIPLNKRVRSLLISWVIEKRDVSLKVLPNMLKKYVIYGVSNTGASLSWTQVRNTTLYSSKSDLPSQNAKAVNLDITLDAGIGNAYHVFSSHVHILYGKTWIEGSGSTESKDEVKSSGLYQWKGWIEGGAGGSWYPIPFIEMSGNTEVTTSLDKGRVYALSGIAGLGLEPWKNRLFFKMGAGLRRSRDSNGTNEYSTGYFGWQLTGGPLTKIYRIPIKGESRLDGYLYKKDNLIWDIQATTKIYLLTSEMLSFFLSHTFTGYKEGTRDWLWVSEFMFGLNVSLSGTLPIM